VANRRRAKFALFFAFYSSRSRYPKSGDRNVTALLRAVTCLGTPELTMAKGNRKRLVIEPAIQYSLVRQLVAQWCLHLTATVLLLIMLQILLGGIFQPWQYHFQRLWPMVASLVITLAFLAPAFIVSSLKLSNRFVGPIHRLRQLLRDLADGKPCEDLKFRKGDYWQELATEVERALQALRANNNTGQPANAAQASTSSSGIVLDTNPGVSSPVNLDR
jgi:hypothetical protein